MQWSLMAALLPGCAMSLIWSQPPLRRSLAVVSVFALLVLALARPDDPVPAGRATCVGEITRGVFEGRCLTALGWESARLSMGSSSDTSDERIVVVDGVLDPGGPPKGPGLLDTRAYNRQAGLGGRLRKVGEPRMVAVAASRWSLQRSIRAHHHRRFQRLDRTGLVAAMAVGDRSGLSLELKDRFRRAGLSHLLAISGFHVGLIGLVAYVVTGGLAVRVGNSAHTVGIVRAGITLAVIAAYSFVAGGSPSTIRATLMGAILLARRTRGHPQVVAVHTLGLAALAYLVWKPESLWSPGFLMSVSAVYGLLSDARIRSKREGRFRPSSFLVPTLCAVLFTSPVTAGVFGTVTPVSLLSNIVATPLAALILLGSALTDVMPLELLHRHMALSTSLIADLLDWTAALFAHVPPLEVSSHQGFVLALALSAGRLPRTPGGRRWVSTALVIAVLLPAWPGISRRPLEVTFLDVGQGDAAIIRTPTGRIVFVDSGPPGRGSVLLSAMTRYPGHRVDVVVTSHAHADHDGGLPSLKRRYPHARFLTGTEITAGSVIQLDSEVRAFVLAPFNAPAQGSDPNEESVVLALQHGNNRFLFTGDAEKRSETLLVHHWDTLLDSEVVKVPHHGSQTSSRPYFLARFRESHSRNSRLDDPSDYTGAGHRWAIVSVGAHNRFGLPDESVITAWQRSGFTVFSTADHGSIRCKSDLETVRCVPFAQVPR